MTMDNKCMKNVIKTSQAIDNCDNYTHSLYIHILNERKKEQLILHEVHREMVSTTKRRNDQHISLSRFQCDMCYSRFSQLRNMHETYESKFFILFKSLFLVAHTSSSMHDRRVFIAIQNECRKESQGPPHHRISPCKKTFKVLFPV